MLVSVPLNTSFPLFAALAEPAAPKPKAPSTASVREIFFMLTTFLAFVLYAHHWTNRTITARRIIRCQDNHIMNREFGTGKAGTFCGNIPDYR
jgi:hypothetical protein